MGQAGRGMELVEGGREVKGCVKDRKQLRNSLEVQRWAV